MSSSTLISLLVVLSSLLTLTQCQECPRSHECSCDLMEKREVKSLDVDCSEKKHQRVPDLSYFQGMAIQLLNLADIGITSLPAGAFEGLFFRGTSFHSDPMIDLSNNPLQVISSGAFSGIRSSGVGLRMTDCRLDSFPTELSQLTNLTFLFIGNNRFTSIPPGAFKHFKKLRLISLSKNSLGALEPGAFHGLENVLEKVILESTALETFPTAALEKLKQLEMLQLNKNSIKKLEAGALSNFKTTKKLDLNLVDNGLESIDPDALTGAKFQLKSLKLTGNKITDLMFLDNVVCTKMFARTPHVYMMESPLTCNCDTYATLSSHRVLVDGTCESPENVKGLNIRPHFITKAREEMCKDTKPKCSIASTSKKVSFVTNTVVAVVFILLLL